MPAITLIFLENISECIHATMQGLSFSGSDHEYLLSGMLWHTVWYIVYRFLDQFLP